MGGSFFMVNHWRLPDDRLGKEIAGVKRADLPTVARSVKPIAEEVNQIFLLLQGETEARIT